MSESQVKNPHKNKDSEIDKNFEVFQRMLPNLLGDHRDKHALMRDGKVIAIYSTAQDAVETGQSFYKDGLFSVQKITDDAVDLGFFSHAVHIG